MSGRYRLVTSGRLEFSWGWDGDVTPDTLVSIELSGMDGGGTRLALTHSGFPDLPSRDDHITGWTDCLDRLREHGADQGFQAVDF